MSYKTGSRYGQKKKKWQKFNTLPYRADKMQPSRNVDLTNHRKFRGPVGGGGGVPYAYHLVISHAGR